MIRSGVDVHEDESEGGGGLLFGGVAVDSLRVGGGPGNGLLLYSPLSRSSPSHVLYFILGLRFRVIYDIIARSS